MSTSPGSGFRPPRPGRWPVCSSSCSKRHASAWRTPATPGARCPRTVRTSSPAPASAWTASTPTPPGSRPPVTPARSNGRPWRRVSTGRRHGRPPGNCGRWWPGTRAPPRTTGWARWPAPSPPASPPRSACTAVRSRSSRRTRPPSSPSTTRCTICAGGCPTRSSWSWGSGGRAPSSPRACGPRGSRGTGVPAAPTASVRASAPCCSSGRPPPYGTATGSTPRSSTPPSATTPARAPSAPRATPGCAARSPGSPCARPGWRRTR